jgi:hypothetical protein
VDGDHLTAGRVRWIIACMARERTLGTASNRGNPPRHAPGTGLSHCRRHRVRRRAWTRRRRRCILIPAAAPLRHHPPATVFLAVPCREYQGKYSGWPTTTRRYNSDGVLVLRKARSDREGGPTGQAREQ